MTREEFYKILENTGVGLYGYALHLKNMRIETIKTRFNSLTDEKWNSTINKQGKDAIIKAGLDYVFDGIVLD